MTTTPPLPPPLPPVLPPMPQLQRDLADDAAIRMLIPIGLSWWAIISGYLGLISILAIPGPFAVLTGILAIRDIRRNPKKHGMGRAIFGIVMGSFGTLLLLLVGIAILSDILTAPKATFSTFRGR